MLDILVVPQQCIRLEKEFMSDVNKHSPHSTSRESRPARLLCGGEQGVGSSGVRGWGRNKRHVSDSRAAGQSPVLSKLSKTHSPLIKFSWLNYWGGIGCCPEQFSVNKNLCY